MVTVSPRLWLISLIMYFSREPPDPGPGEERLARILPALTHLSDDDSDRDIDADHSPDGGAGAALHSALEADVDAGADPDHWLAHLMMNIIIINHKSTLMILTSAPGLQAKSSASTSCHP